MGSCARRKFVTSDQSEKTAPGHPSLFSFNAEHYSFRAKTQHSSSPHLACTRAPQECVKTEFWTRNIVWKSSPVPWKWLIIWAVPGSQRADSRVMNHRLGNLEPKIDLYIHSMKYSLPSVDKNYVDLSSRNSVSEDRAWYRYSFSTRGRCSKRNQHACINKEPARTCTRNNKATLALVTVRGPSLDRLLNAIPGGLQEVIHPNNIQLNHSITFCIHKK